MTKTQARLLRFLLELRDNGPECETSGICYNVRKRAVDASGGQFCDEDDAAMRSELRDVFIRLGLNPVYPVHGGPGMYDWYFDTSSNMWDADTEYGALRLELLQDMIDHLRGL